MHKHPPADQRQPRTITLPCDLAVIGGGLAGTCCAITAARAGIKVVLVQDRPILGGNASSEVRLWILGATSHMCNNNRWAREGGVVDEILVENVWRNREGNPVILDTILLEKVIAEPNITLLLNTAVHDLEKTDPATIGAVRAYCSQNSTRYDIRAPLFCDASGDGVVGFQAGAAFRMGAESREEFGEKFAPDSAYGELLGHSLYFYSRDTGRSVRFVPPAFALKDVAKNIPRYRGFNTREYGCRLWWIEYGGRLDTVHQTEEIKWELWKVVYGVWDHIKNSGEFPDAANLTLEWVGAIPGKRESRRFEGDYMLTQQDIIEQRQHRDVVSYGGWSIDLHPADGVFSAARPCDQWHSKGVYGIPWRCMYSRNIGNLFLAGRIISASHVAFGSSRVMGTCAHGGQAVGAAAAMCRREGLLPREVGAGVHLRPLQETLLRSGQYIPGLRAADARDLARSATLSASSRLQLRELPADGPVLRLEQPWAMLIPAAPGALPAFTFTLDVAAATSLRAELRWSSKSDNHTPDQTQAVRSIALQPGARQRITVRFDDIVNDLPRYIFVCLMANPDVGVHLSTRRVTGLLALTTRSTQRPPSGIGVEAFEFWWPQRRPGGLNLALSIEPPLDVFVPANVVNGVTRPVAQPNAWVADLAEPRPTLKLAWSRPQTISRIELTFDTDYDHPMESVLMGHPEAVMPFCVRVYRIKDAAGAVLHACAENHQTRQLITLAKPLTTGELSIELDHPGVPAALFEIRCYGP